MSQSFHATENFSPEYRRDPISRRLVVIAPERSRRPISNQLHPSDETSCPFCPGREHETPNEVLAYREPGTSPDGPGWRLRVVPNKFPAVRANAIDSSNREPVDGSIFESLPAIGRHEVVIESPDHISQPSQLSVEQFREIFAAYRERLIALSEDESVEYVSIFKNVGAEAGASLSHCHSQIVAISFVPELIQQELDRTRDYQNTRGRCLFCDLLDQELRDKVRLVAETPRFAAITAYAGRFAHEVWVLPKFHSSHYEKITIEDTYELSSLMKQVVIALGVVLNLPAYNWYLHTAPCRWSNSADYHWHFEILPRSSKPAGFEWGTGCFVNIISPEAAAAELRAACSA